MFSWRCGALEKRELLCYLLSTAEHHLNGTPSEDASAQGASCQFLSVILQLSVLLNLF